MTGMSDSPLDAAPADALDRAFRLPTHIAEDEDLRVLYQEMVSRLRAESLGLPMHTAQEILIERIATKYVQIKYREEHGWAGMGVNGEKDANAQWLDLLKEWNRVLAAGHEQLRDALLKQAEQIAIEAVNLVDDSDTRQTLRRHFKEKFAAIGY